MPCYVYYDRAVQLPPSLDAAPSKPEASKLQTINQPQNVDTNVLLAMDDVQAQMLVRLLDLLSKPQKRRNLASIGVHANPTENAASVDIQMQPVKPSEDFTEAATEQLQKLGAETVSKFQRSVSNLDRELFSLANGSRRLGSSIGILSSTFSIRQRIVQILFLFQQNVDELFARVPRETRKQFIRQKLRFEEVAVERMKQRDARLPHKTRPSLSTDMKLGAEDFPEQFNAFAKDINTFLKKLNEIPEFTDEAVNDSMNEFATDLEYWASCLKDYRGRFRVHTIRRYVHDLCGEMCQHLDTTTKSLTMFKDIGVPTIEFEQKHAAEVLTNISTVATFFSAVTATTLQFSYDPNSRTRLTDVVNFFWFASLVLSIASAVNSLLGRTWMQAMYRSPRKRVPVLVKIWLYRTPLVFLVFSIASFSVGFCVFAYASQQSTITSVMTTVLTSFSSFGLFAVSSWSIFEQWTFSKYLGKKWPEDVLGKLKPLHWLTSKSYNPYLGSSANSMRNKLWPRPEDLPEDVMEKGSGNAKPSVRTADPDANAFQAAGVAKSSATAEKSRRPSLISRTSAMLVKPKSVIQSSPLRPVEETPPLVAPEAAKQHFARIVRCIGVARRALRAQREALSRRDGEKRPVLIPNANESTQVSLIRALGSLHQTVMPHLVFIKDLEFSPDGKFLATCGTNYSCFIYKANTSTGLHQHLPHSQWLVEQVAWSPDSKMLLTKTPKGVKLWWAPSEISDEINDNRTGTCVWWEDRQHSIQSVAWYPKSDAFLLVEGIKEDKDGKESKESLVMKFGSIAGGRKLLAEFPFKNRLLYDVAITNDSQRMLCVARLTASPDKLKPSVSREERQIIIYNLDKKVIEYQVPTLHNVRNISLARSGNFALVSYKNKAPPQLWLMVSVDEPTKETTDGKSGLVLKPVHSYEPKMPVDFAGPSYFGGKNDELVLSAMKAGDIHIWNRHSGYLLRTLPAQDRENDLTSVAWNHAASALIFASGSSNGTVRIWSSEVNLVPPRDSYGGSRQSGTIETGVNTPAATAAMPVPAATDSENPGLIESISYEQGGMQGAIPTTSSRA